jgi:hypothetical protein
MSISANNKIDLLYKKLFGVAKTDLDTLKSPSNEAIASPTLNRGDKVWVESGSIPASAPASNSSIVQVYTNGTSVQCVADTTATPISSVYPTWKTSLTDWIPVEFGPDYFIKVFVDTAGAANCVSTGTQIFDSGIAGTGEWFFDTSSGVLNFIGGTIPAALTVSKVIFISGYRYVGLKDVSTSLVLKRGDTITGNIVISNTTSSTSNTTGALVVSGGLGVGKDIYATNIYGSLFGNANTATALQTGRYIRITAGDVNANSVYFDGTGNANVAIVLSTMANVTAGQYGSTTEVPVITVASNGRVSNIHTATIATSFTVSGNTGSGTQAGGGTLTLQGGNTGITTTVTGSGGSETVTFNTDNTVVRSNTTAVGGQTIATDLQISGNLIVTGTATYVNTSIVQTNDSLIQLASNNVVGDVIDIGFVGLYNNGANVMTGLVRDAGDKSYYLFKDVSASSLSANNIANNLFTAANTATLYANLVANTATIGTLTITNALPIGSGGTNNTTFTTGSLTFFDGTKLASIANTTYSQTGTLATNNTITSITVDAYGRFTAATVGAISGLTVPQGGTGLSTITSKGITYGNGTGVLGVTAAAGTSDQTFSNQLLTVDNSGTPVWTSTLDGGQF